MELSATFFRNIIRDAIDMGKTIALSEAGIIKPYLNKSEAYKAYGRTNVDKWLKAGLIKPNKDGGENCKWRLERKQLEILAKSNNWSTYVPIDERE